MDSGGQMLSFKDRFCIFKLLYLFLFERLTTNVAAVSTNRTFKVIFFLKGAIDVFIYYYLTYLFIYYLITIINILFSYFDLHK